MGLDVSFSQEEANEVGLTHYEGEMRGGSPEAVEYTIQEEIDNGGISEGYENYLRTRPMLLDIPNTDHCVEVGVCQGVYFVRANKWGETYAPLTEFLKEHGIEWGEG